MRAVIRNLISASSPMLVITAVVSAAPSGLRLAAIGQE
jgi:hypothetical protein